MNIEKTILSEFLGKVAINGQISEVVLNFGQFGMTVVARTSDNVALVNANLFNTAFTKYEAIGEVGIQDICVLEKMVNTFKKEVTIQKTDSLIILSEGDTNIEIPIMDTQFINVPKTPKEIPFPETCEIDYTNITEFFAKTQSFNKNFRVTFTTGDKSLKVLSQDKYKFTSTFPVLGLKSSVSSTFGAMIVNATSKFKSMATISMGQDMPIRVVEKTDFSNVTIFVAPRIEVDE